MALIKSFETQKVSDERIGQILESKEFLEYCSNFLNRVKSFFSILSSLSLSDRIACGKYDLVNSDINEKNFPTKVEKDYEVKYELFHYGKDMSSDSVIADMEKKGF